MEEIDFSELQELVGGVEVDIDTSNDIEIEEAPEVEEVSEETEETTLEEPIKEAEVKEETELKRDVTESYVALQALIDAGELEDFVIEIDGEEIQLSEYKNIDKETLKDVIATYKETLEKETKENFVSVKDLDEKKKALIDIIIKGDYDQVQDILSEPSVLKDPFEGFDNSNQEHNIKVYMAYLTSAKGHPQDEAEALAEIAIKNNTIDEKALKIVEGHRENTKQAILEEKKRVETLEIEKKERIKSYAKDLDNTYKEYGLRPEKTLELKKLATQFNKVGNLPIDEIYEEVMQDPKKAADLVLFLADRELYDKRVYANAKKESDIQTVRKIQLVSNTKKKSSETEFDNKDIKTLSEFENIIIED